MNGREAQSCGKDDLQIMRTGVERPPMGRIAFREGWHGHALLLAGSSEGIHDRTPDKDWKIRGLIENSATTGTALMLLIRMVSSVATKKSPML